MKIQTFSVVVGTQACDANCPFCVSHITGFDNLGTPEINFRNFRKAVALARHSGCTTLLFTGKGEPTLYPDELSAYLLRLYDMIPENGVPPFPFLELQTNALQIGYLAAGKTPKYQQMNKRHLTDWWDYGLNTICISVVGIDPKHNSEVYCADYPDLAGTVEYLIDLGYSVRLCVMMQNGKVDTPEKVFEVTDWCKDHGVAQCTVRPIRRTKRAITIEGVLSGKMPVLQPDPYADYVQKHGLDQKQEQAIAHAVEDRSELIMTLMNGSNEARVYDVDGQNLCVSDCLTIEPTGDDIRTLIFYSDGKVMYDWVHDGARLL